MLLKCCCHENRRHNSLAIPLVRIMSRMNSISTKMLHVTSSLVTEIRSRNVASIYDELI